MVGVGIWPIEKVPVQLLKRGALKPTLAVGNTTNVDGLQHGAKYGQTGKAVHKAVFCGKKAIFVQDRAAVERHVVAYEKLGGEPCNVGGELAKGLSCRNAISSGLGSGYAMYVYRPVANVESVRVNDVVLD